MGLPTGPRAAAVPGTGLRLVRAGRRTFAGPAEFLGDPVERAGLDTYLSDLTRAYPPPPAPAAPLGQSYGEMAEALIAAVVRADEPVGLLVLAYAIHDMQPGRATATYLSHVCPGNPMAFAICDQGSAGAYSGLRIARDYPAVGGVHRSLLIVVEQAELPYGDAAARPAEHRGVAMLFERGPAQHGPTGARLVALRQRPNVAAGAVAGQLSADLAELSSGREVRVVASQALAAAWPERQDHRVLVGPGAQPLTGLWWQLLDELDAGAGGADLLVAADYDHDLGYLCLAALELVAAQPAVNSSRVRPAVPE